MPNPTHLRHHWLTSETGQASHLGLETTLLIEKGTKNALLLWSSKTVSDNKEMPVPANDISELEESHRSSSPAAVALGSMQMGTELPKVVS